MVRSLIQKGKPMKFRVVHSKTLKKRTAAEVFKKCPACGASGLLRVDPEVVCLECPWDSCLASVEAGLMDDFFTQAMRASRLPQVLKSTDHYIAPEKIETQTTDMTA